MTKLPEWVKPGVSYSYFNRRFHVRGIVDGQAVLREWWPHKKRWNYSVEDPVFYEIADRHCIKRKLRGAPIKDQP